jgi:hypothetical protein
MATPAAAPSFAAAASGAAKADAPLTLVRIDAHVLLRIAKHCRACAPSLVTGQLLGLDVGTTLEVTEAFPFPVSGCGWDGMCVREGRGGGAPGGGGGGGAVSVFSPIGGGPAHKK